MREFRRSCHGCSYDQVDSETEEAPELGRFLSAYSLGDCYGFENIAEVRYSNSGAEEMELDEEAARMEFKFVLGVVLKWLKD
ncbi:hypothetical protein Droror1_Dr00028242 [Drosera rotundifolia]